MACSVIVAGLLVWRNPHLSSALAVGLDGLVALAHGYVHAAELTDGVDAWSYAAGFLLTTAVLHGLGVAFGFLMAARLKMLAAGFGLLCAGVGLGLLAGI